MKRKDETGSIPIIESTAQKDEEGSEFFRPTRREFLLATVAAASGLTIWSCGTDENESDSSTDVDSDVDSDADADTDADTDTDSDSDSDTDTDSDSKTKVYVIKTDDRVSGLTELLGLVSLGFAAGKNIVLKPNYNSSSSFPASTHNDTVTEVVGALRSAGCGDITLAESSGPAGTSNVIEDLGTLEFCKGLGIDFLNFDTMPGSDWEEFDFEGNGWPGGLAIPKIMRSDHAVVLLPCCKTHAYGGHFTLSLKLAVGLVPKSRRAELHHGEIRSLIADINYGFTPDLIVMDAMECFTTGGPDSGNVAYPGLLLASTDRIALDAVAVAVLKSEGAEGDGGVLVDRPIFEQDQIVRAVELGLGVSSADEIEMVGNDDATMTILQNILNKG